MAGHTEPDTSIGSSPAPGRVLKQTADTFADADALLEVGAVIFSLMSDWSAWIHRRVETLKFHDTNTVRRRVSVDLTWPDVPTPLEEGTGSAMHLVLLGTLRKRRLTNFDLQDESGRSLPLISKSTNGAVAAAVLLEAAQAWPEAHGQLGKPPAPVLTDLWKITNENETVALDAWHRLAQPVDSSNTQEMAWRAALASSVEFRALASDLARNFLVLTPSVLRAKDRRIFKFAYDTPAVIPLIAVQGSKRWWQRVSAEGAAPSPAEQDAPTEAEPEVRCTVKVTARDETNQAPLAGVGVTLRKSRTVKLRTRADGTISEQVGVGKCEVHDIPPEGYIRTTPHDALRMSLKGDTTIELTYQPETVRVADPPEMRLSIPGKLRRLAAIEAKDVEIRAPSIGQCVSYHLELEVPAGLKVTRAELEDLPAFTSGGAAKGAHDSQADVHDSTAHRVHLYRSEVPQSRTGNARFYLRPHPSTVLRGAFSVSALSLVLLLILVLRWDELGVTGVGSAIALLLAVPGGLAAYVARSQSSRFTTEALVGLRLLSLTTIVWGAAAGTAILISRAVTFDEEGKMHVGSALWWTDEFLIVLVAANAIVASTLALALGRSRKPPESATSRGEN